MSADDLLCAACGGRVGDAGCPTCRASRAYLREQGTGVPVGPFLLAALLVLLLLVALHS